MKSGGKPIEKNLIRFSENSGQLWEGGDYIVGEKKEGGEEDKVFKDEILRRFTKVIILAVKTFS